MAPAPQTSAIRIAIVGGGLSGLAAALRISDLASEQGQPVETTLLEASDRPGGLIQTQRIGEYLVERGADSLITNKPGGVWLAQRLGLENRLVGTNPEFRKSFIVRQGQLVPTPEGFQLLAPVRLLPFLKSPLLSWPGKLRTLMDVVVPRRKLPGDESLADFVTRRFGRELLDRIVQPLVGGIYTSDPARLSLAATQPRFCEMEQSSGSVIRALRSSPPGDPPASGARYGLFVSLPGGLEELVVAAAQEVGRVANVRLGQPVLGLSPAGSLRSASPPRGWRVQTAAGEQLFDAVIIALKAFQAADLIRPWELELAARLAGIEYASSAIVVSGHDLADVRHPLDGAGLVIPHAERRGVIAVSFASRKFAGRAPAGRVLLRTFVGGAMQPEKMSLDDGALKSLVSDELSALLGVSGRPDFMEVVRYNLGMPQYHVGHLDRVARIAEDTAGLPGLALCGNAYRGVGIPDAIDSGTQAAEKVWNDLGQRLREDTSGRLARTTAAP